MKIRPVPRKSLKWAVARFVRPVIARNEFSARIPVSY